MIYGFIVGAWMIWSAANHTPIPFSTLELCKAAEKQMGQGFDAHYCVKASEPILSWKEQK